MGWVHVIALLFFLTYLKVETGSGYRGNYNWVPTRFLKWVMLQITAAHSASVLRIYCSIRQLLIHSPFTIYLFRNQVSMHGQGWLAITKIYLDIFSTLNSLMISLSVADILHGILDSDVKRGQNLETEARVLRPRPRPRLWGQGQSRGQFLEAEAKDKAMNTKY